jgi:hypothetical protein
VKEGDVTVYFGNAKNKRRYSLKISFRPIYHFRLFLLSDILIIGNRNNVNSNIKYFMIGQLLLANLLVEDIPEDSGIYFLNQFILISL